MNAPDETIDSIPENPKSHVGDTPPTDNSHQIGSCRIELTDPDFARAADHPLQIGRYRIVNVLGEGGSGRVYLAHDDQLNRPVAIKVPRPGMLSRPEDTEAYLAEARTVASLDHPNIVPIFDIGTTPEGVCFVVSKVIEGSDLAKRMGQARPSYGETARLLVTIAEALHYAHSKGLVHRDIKPANILIDTSYKPYVADFGLALKEEDYGKGPNFAGTPTYMSPEQANGEGHRVDGRADIFSLGVVFYELLTGRRPFRGDMLQVLFQIASTEPRPPRQVDDGIPKELERICLKALAKRASERFTTAKDMAEDLRHFLTSAEANAKSTESLKPVQDTVVSTPVPGSALPPISDQRRSKIMPKGLRSFDANDADFFLELLPGPRDRDGLPDSIRFWKIRIEATDSDNTFSVGLIYGPSGCGKSSLVKAGLLPRLARHVIAVYVEATAEETEFRLLKGLRKHCPDVPENLGVIETLASLRRGHYLPVGKKVVIVLDQFEQWLHAKKENQNTELIQALRQCDGERVQGVVMVRDDFGMAATRFMKALEVEILEGHNFATVDLFDLLHSRKVLSEFGRAFGRLPDNLGRCTKDQEAFLDQAVSGLAQEGKVISVRLALFAEMVKGKPWTPATLKEVGGMEGVGVSFMEETFTSTAANPKHRLHQKAAQAVLKALLPEVGTDIKGHMRSQQELLEASGYCSRSRDFDELIRLLDSEIRFITPTDPEGRDRGDESTSQARPGQKCYQLTHDYLVPSLRDWLTRKQKETRRGRAELLLADRASVWNARPENRQLPSFTQWLQIRRLTMRKNWTPPQSKMMRKASRYHAVRGLVAIVLLSLIVWGGYEGQGRLKAHALRDRLLDANTNEVPTIVANMSSYRRWIVPLLRDPTTRAEASRDARKQLHSSLALLPMDATQVDYLYGRLLNAAPHDLPVIRDALASHKNELQDKLWVVVETPPKGKESQRLRAAAALAMYDAESEKWARMNALVVNDLVLENAVFLGQWSEAFRPVKDHLVSPLSVIFRDHLPDRTAERSIATNLLGDYAAGQPLVLADLLMDADDKQFSVIYPKFKEQGGRGLSRLIGEIDGRLPPDATDLAKEKRAKRQANAAVALLRMKQSGKVWPLLKHGPDPRVRSYLIHRLKPLGIDSQTIISRLKDEPDITIKRALLLSLGEYGEKELPPEVRKALLPNLQEIYRTTPDPGLHASAEWLLRQWKQEAWLKQVNGDWARDTKLREKATRAALSPGAMPQWYVNGQGQTMVVISGPVTFLMGSPPTEAGRQSDEPRHKKRIGRTFALASKAVTVEQYRQFDKGYTLPAVYTRTADLPVVGTSWYQGAAYCNWLSKEEGIDEEQWCYKIKGNETNLKANYLSLTGYRLPTEAEMEYGTRAGALTSRYFGETDELLPRYAWYLKNSQEKPWPVGSLKPNDLGLFDMMGNVYTWCQEGYKEYPKVKGEEVAEDKEDTLVVNRTGIRVLRGGSFYFRPSSVRSANRFSNVPSYQYNYFGFRPARTIAH